MDRDKNLKASRRENRNRDLAELEVMYQARSYAARVGASVCCALSLLSSLIARIMLYSPWTIYFSLMGTQWVVRFCKLRKKSDLVMGVVFLLLAVLALVGVIQRLLEAAL